MALCAQPASRKQLHINVTVAHNGNGWLVGHTGGMRMGKTPPGAGPGGKERSEYRKSDTGSIINRSGGT